MASIRVQIKIIILLFLLIVSLAVGLSYLFISEHEKADILFKETEHTKNKFLEQIIEIKGFTFKALAVDYTFWDDMVEFVSTGDQNWARENIDTSLQTFGASVCWVCRPDFSLVYSVNNLDDPRLKELPFSAQDLRQLFSSGYFRRFFVNTGSGLMETYTAPIQPNSDLKRESKPQGFFIVGRIWNSEYLEELSQLTGNKLRVIPAEEGVPYISYQRGSGELIISNTLTDWADRPVAKVYAKTESAIIKAINRYSQRNTGFIFIFAFFVLLLFVFFFIRWIGRPLALISRSLETQDISVTKALEADRTEFGNIASLISNFFQQKDMLIKEVMERENAESALQKAKDELEIKVAERTRELKTANERLLVEFEERHRLHEQFLQAQKMESIGRLAGGVAHDFNNLLTIIINYAILARDILPQENQVRQDVEEILKAGQRAANLTRQLLAFSRHQLVFPQVVNINELIINMEKMLRRLIGENIELIIALDRELKSIKADPGNIEQIMVNLVVNAQDAIISTQGRIKIETVNVIFDQKAVAGRVGLQPGEYVVLMVSDTGMGMSEEVKNHLFEPFFTTKSPGKGTGLGLATIYGVVKQHHGYVEVDSQEGKGTIFRIYFSAVSGGKTGSPDEKEDSFPRGNETVLLVEDNASVRYVTVRMLEKLGYKVLVSASGEEAMNLAAGYNGDIHLLMTDVVLSGISGKELAEKILSLKPDIKVLFISGYTDEAVSLRGLESQEANFLQKPFTQEALAQKARKILNG